MTKKKSPPPLDRVDVNTVPVEELDALVKRLEAEKLRRELVKLRADEEYGLSSESNLRRVKFFTSVGGNAVYTATTYLDRFMTVDPGCDILIEINSPGGAVFDGFALVDKIFEVRAAGHYIITRAFGMCASMGMALLAAGDTRQMSEYAHLMVHEISSGSIGTYSEIQDEVELLGKLQDRYFTLVADRTRYSVKQLKKRVERKDFWMNADEALADGFVDEIYGRSNAVN